MSSRTTIAAALGRRQRTSRWARSVATSAERGGPSLILSLSLLYAPFALGALITSPELSIGWSFSGSVFIAILAQTRLFTGPTGTATFNSALLRPTFMFHLMFVAYHVMGGAIHVLNAAGFVLWERGAPLTMYDPALLAECQRLMLFAHSSVTAGMALVGFRYAAPRYRVAISRIPPFAMLLFAVAAEVVGTLMRAFPGLFSFGEKIASLGAAAILVQIVFSIRTKSYVTLMQAIGVFGLTFAAQAISGWKGSILWSAIALGAWLFPLRPKATVCAALAFVMFWGLWFYPFASNLRRPLWYEGVSRERAVEIALDQTRELTFWQRAETLWTALSVRGSDLSHFEKYVSFVPDAHPFYGLEFMSNAMIALTPRILWPDKPDIEHLSMERVYEVGITFEEVIVSSKSNLYQDGYLSGGYAGVLILCLALGCSAMWISRTCERFFGGYDLGTGLIYLGLFATQINQALNVEFLLSSIAGSAIVALVMFGVARSAGWLAVNTQPHGDPGATAPVRANRRVVAVDSETS